MKYKVHLFPVVHLPAIEVEAENHQKAIEKAYDIAESDGNGIYNLIHRGFEYADEISCFLVDEVGDEEHRNSRYYDELGRPTGRLGIVVQFKEYLKELEDNEYEVPKEIKGYIAHRLEIEEAFTGGSQK